MWVNIGWSVVNLLPILPLDGGNIAASIVGAHRARIVSMVVAVAVAIYFFEQQNQFAGFFLMMFALMNFGAYQQEKAGHGEALPSQAQRPPRAARTPVPARSIALDIHRSDDREQLEGLAWNALRTNDVLGARRVLSRHPSPDKVSPFLWGSLALAEGRTAEGIEAFVAGYDAQPGGPASLVPATLLARTGQAAALAQRLLQGGGTAPQAAAALQSHLHYADCFRESAAVGALLYEDGRANRAQSAFEVACSLARTGDQAGALAWIERAIDAGFTAGPLLDGEPDLASIRRLAEWPAARARVR
jgi:hypothetical protein